MLVGKAAHEQSADVGKEDATDLGTSPEVSEESPTVLHRQIPRPISRFGRPRLHRGIGRRVSGNTEIRLNLESNGGRATTAKKSAAMAVTKTADSDGNKKRGFRDPFGTRADGYGGERGVRFIEYHVRLV